MFTGGRQRGHTSADAMLHDWYTSDGHKPVKGRARRRISITAPPQISQAAARESMVGRMGRKSVLKRNSSREVGSLGDVAALVLHGAQKLNPDDATYIQHLSSAVAKVAPSQKLDTCGFTWADRFAAWFTGYGRELRQLKEVQLSDAPGADGLIPTPSALTRLRRRSLVLIGAEARAIDRGVGAQEGELGSGRPDGVVRAMLDLMLRAHFEAATYGQTSSDSLDADDLLQTVKDFRDDYPLSAVERLYLRACGGFTEEEKAILLENAKKLEALRLAAAEAEAEHGRGGGCGGGGSADASTPVAAAGGGGGGGDAAARSKKSAARSASGRLLDALHVEGRGGANAGADHRPRLSVADLAAANFLTSPKKLSSIFGLDPPPAASARESTRARPSRAPAADGSSGSPAAAAAAVDAAPGLRRPAFARRRCAQRRRARGLSSACRRRRPHAAMAAVRIRRR